MLRRGPFGLLLLSLLCAGGPAVFGENSLSRQQSDFRELRRFLKIYRVIIPHPVEDVLESIDKEISIRFNCAEVPMPDRDHRGVRVPDIEGGRRVLPAQTVVIKIATRIAPWTGAGEADINGRYEWNLREGYEPSGLRQPGTCGNFLRLDPGYLNRRGERPAEKRIGSVVLLYHELLHGQLLIDAIRDDPVWQANYCNIFRSARGQKKLLAAADTAHLRISVLEEKFREILTRVVSGRESDGQDPWSPIPAELTR